MIGCLCLHGFTGGPFEVQPVTDFLKKKHMNWEISVPTYPGHGEVLSLRGVRQDLWVEEAERAFLDLRKKHDTLYVIGFSMGGMIAGYLAAKYGCEKLVLLSASALYINPLKLTKEVGGWMDMRRAGAVPNEWMYKQYWHRMTATPVSALFQFRKLVKALKPSLAEVTAPTLIIQGESDGLVPVRSARYIYDTIASEEKQLCYFKHSKHMICHDCEQEQLFFEIDRFLNEPKK